MCGPTEGVRDIRFEGSEGHGAFLSLPRSAIRVLTVFTLQEANGASQEATAWAAKRMLAGLAMCARGLPSDFDMSVCARTSENFLCVCA